MTPCPLAAVGEMSESVMITLRNSNTHFLAGCVISKVLDEYGAGSNWVPGSTSLSLSDASWEFGKQRDEMLA